MNFISWPLLWGGAAAISAPILIHLLNRQRYKRIRWAAMEFLLLAFKRTRRRIRIEHLIMLLIRCLMLLMLGMALARPIFGGFIVSGHRDVYVLLDDSYSMGYQSADGNAAFERARKRLKQILSGLRLEDRLHVVRVSDAIRRQSAKPEDADKKAEKEDDADRRSLVVEVVREDKPLKDFMETTSLDVKEKENFLREADRIGPSDLHTDIYAGLERMDKLISGSSDPTQPVKELYVISDFQEYAWLPGEAETPATPEGGDAKKGPEIPTKRYKGARRPDEFSGLFEKLTAKKSGGSETKIFLMDVGDVDLRKKGATSDILIDLVWADPKELVTGFSPRFKARVWNNSDNEATNIKLSFYIDDATTPVDDKTILSIKPRQSEEVTFQKKIFKDNESGAHYARIVHKDNLTANSTYYFSFEIRKSIRVLLVDGDYNEDLMKSETGVLQFILHPASRFSRDGVDGSASRGSEFKLHTSVPVIVDKLLKESDGIRYDSFDIVAIANLKITSQNPGKAELNMLKDYVNSGGRVMMFLGDNVDPGEYNPRLYAGAGILPVKLAIKTRGKKYYEVDKIEETSVINSDGLTHEIFHPLVKLDMLKTGDAQPLFSRYFPIVEVAEGSEVVAYLFDRDPAHKEEKIPFQVIKRFPNDGVVAVFNTTADSAWSNLTSSAGPDTVYFVMVHETMLYMLRTGPANLGVGDLISKTIAIPSKALPVNMEEIPFRVMPPKEDSYTVLKLKDEDVRKIDRSRDKQYFQIIYRDAFSAGRYKVWYDKKSWDKAEHRELFTVNVDFGEADLRFTNPETVKKRYTSLIDAKIIEWNKSKEDGGSVEKIGEERSSSDAWKLPLFILLGLLVLESGLALWFGHRATR
ncbi:MAG: BatA domain-containing protein [Planctomycetota bacterium]